MIEYVNGFLFSPDRYHVALVLKNKPPWQAGHFNAIGGKKKPGETWLEAMAREFDEETGVHIKSWEHTLTLRGSEWELRFYRAFFPLVHAVQTMESETILVVPVDRIGHLGYVHGLHIIPNLAWALPLSLDDHLDFPVLAKEKA